MSDIRFLSVVSVTDDGGAESVVDDDATIGRWCKSEGIDMARTLGVARREQFAEGVGA